MHVSYRIPPAAATAFDRWRGCRHRRLPPALVLAVIALLAANGLRPARALGAPEATVYVTETGRSYHRDGCPYLQRTRLPLPLSEATALGYAPCGVCLPPLNPDAAPPGSRPPPAGLYRVDLARVTRSEPGELDSMPRALVVRCVDGDTVYVALPRPPEGLGTRERLRLIGVDSPEAGRASPTAQRLALAASEFTRRRLEGRIVYLACDWRLRDRYGRLLAYVYLPDGSCHNAELLREGYAHAYTRFPFQFLEEFRALEAAARRGGRGLWAPDGP
jgi:micrococcal nuclease